MTLEEQRRKDAYSLLNNLIKAEKLERKKFKSLGEIEIIGLKSEIQVWKLIQWCELLEMPYNREDWGGNKSCGSNWDIVYFTYKGFTFFELVEKEN